MLKIGILSGATIVPRFVAGVRASGVAEVAGIATRSLEKTEKLASDLAIPQVFESYDALLASPELDLAYIPLINSEHFRMAEKALLAGKNVLLEKPFTMTAAESIRLFELAQQQNCFLMEAQKAVFLPVIQETKKLIEQGAIGEVQHIDFIESRPGYETIPWFNDLSAGGGTLISNASYPMSVLQFLFGKGFDEFMGMHKSFTPADSDNECQILLRKGKLFINLFQSSVMKFQSYLEIQGSKGKIKIADYWKTESLELTRDGKKEIFSFPHESEFSYEIEHVRDCIADGKIESPLVPWEMTLATVSTVEKLYQEWYGLK